MTLRNPSVKILTESHLQKERGRGEDSSLTGERRQKGYKQTHEYVLHNKDSQQDLLIVSFSCEHTVCSYNNGVSGGIYKHLNF